MKEMEGIIPHIYGGLDRVPPWEQTLPFEISFPLRFSRPLSFSPSRKPQSAGSPHMLLGTVKLYIDDVAV